MSTTTTTTGSNPRKLACDGCRKSKVRCDGKEGVSTCSRCLKKSTECTWDTPRSKRGRKSLLPRTMQTETGMGLFCLTPKNLIELNYNLPNSASPNVSESPSGTDSSAEILPHPHASHLPATGSLSSPNLPHPNHIIVNKNHHHPNYPNYNHSFQSPNWTLPLPVQARERFYPKAKSNSLEGLPSFYKFPSSLRASPRPRYQEVEHSDGDVPFEEQHFPPGIINNTPGRSSSSAGGLRTSQNNNIMNNEEEGESPIPTYPLNKRGFYGRNFNIHNNVEVLSDEERVRRKCSIGALINSDEEDYMAFS